MENGTIRPMAVKVGDNVLLPEYGGAAIKLADEQELKIFRDDEIIGILNEKVSE